MAGPTRRPPERTKGAARARRDVVVRFDSVERAIHWVNALLFGVLMFTGAALYIEPLTALIGRRNVVQNIHVACGIALPIPILAAVIGRWGKGFRADLRRFNRWSEDDRLWMRAVALGRERRRELRAHLRAGKFNAGQKLNAAFTGGAIAVLLGSGVIMKWYHPWPLSFRTGATFVHNWLSFAVFMAVTGHICYALSDRDAMRSMRNGLISTRWAAEHAPRWLEELEDVSEQKQPAAPGPGKTRRR